MAKKPEKKEAADGAEGAPAGGKKKLIMFGGAGVVVLLVAVGAAWFLGFFGGGKAKPAVDAHGAPVDAHGAPAAAGGAKEPVFVDLPEMTVNLSAADGRSAFLKVKVTLEVGDKDLVNRINPVLPRVLDAFQVYLRELRPSDLDGSAGLFRVKEELQRRINVAIHPARVEAVLFREIVVQ